MPSSTSSSERPIPPGAWGATWLVALTIAIIATYWAERALRARGQRPSVVDDPVWWSLTRRSIDNDPNVVAFVGTSRMQLAYDGAAFATAAPPPLRGVQLAINGVTAWGVLADLAGDPTFRGIAIVDLDEWDIAWGDPQQLAKPYIERSHALWRAPGAIANRWLASHAQEHLASLAIGGRTIVTSLGRGKLPSPTWVAMDRDRISHGDYSLAPPSALRAKATPRYKNFDAPALPADAWVAQALAIEPYVQAIRARGGDVIVVRLPVSGRLWELFEQHYPKARYWDAFAAKSSAYVVHFKDVPALAPIVCPDEMHVDQRDQTAFTNAILEVVRGHARKPRR